MPPIPVSRRALCPGRGVDLKRNSNCSLEWQILSKPPLYYSERYQRWLHRHHSNVRFLIFSLPFLPLGRHGVKRLHKWRGLHFAFLFKCLVVIGGFPFFCLSLTLQKVDEDDEDDEDDENDASEAVGGSVPKQDAANADPPRFSKLFSFVSTCAGFLRSVIIMPVRVVRFCFNAIVRLAAFLAEMAGIGKDATAPAAAVEAKHVASKVCPYTQYTHAHTLIPYLNKINLPYPCVFVCEALLLHLPLYCSVLDFELVSRGSAATVG